MAIGSIRRPGAPSFVFNNDNNSHSQNGVETKENPSSVLFLTGSRFHSGSFRVLRIPFIASAIGTACECNPGGPLSWIRDGTIQSFWVFSPVAPLTSATRASPVTDRNLKTGTTRKQARKAKPSNEPHGSWKCSRRSCRKASRNLTASSARSWVSM
jgi:hypothetical protein